MKAQCLKGLPRRCGAALAKGTRRCRAVQTVGVPVCPEQRPPAKEGGVFGIGGERVSEAETAALNEIAVALDIPNLSGA